jgi:recombination protein U
MSTWAKRGLRGSTLESYINITNEKYREQGLALVEKIPTPIKAVKLNAEKGNISEAYFEKRSSVDYIGVVQGIPICFDAKETNKNLLPLQNIHEHQITFMENFTKQQGIAFLIVHFTKVNEMYLLPQELISRYFEDAKKGGRKSIPYSIVKEQIPIIMKPPYMVHYLEALNQYLVNIDYKN